MDRLRKTEYQSFAKVDYMRKKDDGGLAYKLIEDEKKIIKDRIKKLGNKKFYMNDEQEYDSEEGFYENDD